MQIEATLRVTGCDIFRRERWLSSVRPVLVRILGHEDNTKPEWVGTYKRVVATLWNLLSEDEKAQYNKMAEEEDLEGALNKVVRNVVCRPRTVRAC